MPPDDTSRWNSSTIVQPVQFQARTVRFARTVRLRCSASRASVIPARISEGEETADSPFSGHNAIGFCTRERRELRSRLFDEQHANPCEIRVREMHYRTGSMKA